MSCEMSLVSAGNQQVPVVNHFCALHMLPRLTYLIGGYTYRNKQQELVKESIACLSG